MISVNNESVYIEYLNKILRLFTYFYCTYSNYKLNFIINLEYNNNGKIISSQMHLNQIIT